MKSVADQFVWSSISHKRVPGLKKVNREDYGVDQYWVIVFFR